jgi:hypothetical protein
MHSFFIACGLESYAFNLCTTTQVLLSVSAFGLQKNWIPKCAHLFSFFCFFIKHKVSTAGCACNVKKSVAPFLAGL